MTKPILYYRLRPSGFAAFIECALMQHRHLSQSWPSAIRVAWKYGPIRVAKGDTT